MGSVGSVCTASKTGRPDDGRYSSQQRRGRARPAMLVGALGLIAICTAAPAAAWHTPGLERWRGYDPYWRPYMEPRRPPARPKKRARPAEPPRSGLAEIAKGQLHIVVSLNAQRLQVYSDGIRVAESPVSTGTASHPTPTGLFNVIQKNRFHRSNLYSNAPMPYMQRLTWSGIALHEGHLPGYPASHGCIRLPRAFAQELWRTTRLGARVIVAQDAVAPVAIAHARLAALVPKPDEDTPTRSTETAARVRIAAASITDAGAEAAPAAMREDGAADEAGIVAAKDLALQPGPVSLFVSRKDGKLYVRKGFTPIYSAPVTIRDKDEPLGTHLFTAQAADGDEAALRWTVISLAGAAAPRIAAPERRSRRARRAGADEAPPPSSTVAAAAALERIQIPQEALDFVADLVSPGAALIVSDQGLGHETGLGTDFIVVTQ